MVGFNINGKRIEELKAGEDITRELSAEELAAAPELSFSTSRVSDGVGPHFAEELVNKMIKAGYAVARARVLGFAFNESCPDLRNTRVIDVADSWASSKDAQREYGISLIELPQVGSYDALLLAVPHSEYASIAANDLRDYLKEGGVLFDLKGVLPTGSAVLKL